MKYKYFLKGLGRKKVKDMKFIKWPKGEKKCEINQMASQKI